MNLKEPFTTFAYYLISLHHDIMWYLIIILSIVYWVLFKTLLDYSWNSYNKLEGFLLHGFYKKNRFYKIQKFILYLWITVFNINCFNVGNNELNSNSLYYCNSDDKERFDEVSIIKDGEKEDWTAGLEDDDRLVDLEDLTKDLTIDSTEELGAEEEPTDDQDNQLHDGEDDDREQFDRHNRPNIDIRDTELERGGDNDGWDPIDDLFFNTDIKQLSNNETYEYDGKLLKGYLFNNVNVIQGVLDNWWENRNPHAKFLLSTNFDEKGNEFNITFNVCNFTLNTMHRKNQYFKKKVKLGWNSSGLVSWSCSKSNFENHHVLSLLRNNDKLLLDLILSYVSYDSYSVLPIYKSIYSSKKRRNNNSYFTDAVRFRINGYIVKELSYEIFYYLKKYYLNEESAELDDVFDYIVLMWKLLLSSYIKDRRKIKITA